jgi:hypothetical protein
MPNKIEKKRNEKPSKISHSLLLKNDIILTVIDRKNYSNNISHLIKAVADTNNLFLYISANKPEDLLLENIKKAGVNSSKLLIVDCVAKSSKPTKKNVIHIGSRSLTNLSIISDKSLNKGISTVFFDSLSSLLSDNKSDIVIRFSHDLISKIRAKKKKGVFVILNGEISQALLDDLSMFVDKVIEL